MLRPLPADIELIGPEWLTDALKSSGYLSQGAVLSVEVSSFETPPSLMAYLRVRYSDDTPPNCPGRLVLKVPKPHKLAAFQRELRFYTTIAPLMGDTSPLAHCYVSQGSPEDGRTFLLLSDLSETHQAITGTPTLPQLEAILASCARLHAAWWNHSELPELVGESAEQAYFGDFNGNERRYAELLQRFADRIPSQWRHLYERAFQLAPGLITARLRLEQNMTLCHPDSHPGNYLVRREGQDLINQKPTATIIDWHAYRVWWGAGDLTKLFSRSIGQETTLQKSLLRYYHGKLQEYGVTGYDWQDLWDDYRLAVLDYLFQPLGNRNTPWAWSELETAMYMFNAYQCEELLATT